MDNQNIILGVILVLAGLLIGHYVWSNTITIEVPGPERVVEKNVSVPYPSMQVYTDQALNDFWTEVEDEEKLHYCNGHEYDMNDIVLSKMYSDSSIENTDEDTYTVSFEAKLKYAEDGQKSCFENYKVSVFYDEDENPEVTVK